MKICRKTLLSVVLLGIFGFMFCQWDLFEVKRERIQQQQEQRKRLIMEQCDIKEKSLQALLHSQLKNFIVDDKNGLIYCYIPKAACSSWKRVLIVLNQSEPYPDPMSLEQSFVHTPNRFILLNNFPRREMMIKLKHYTKFMFVRDPFIRLISAYRDKFLRYSEYFYQKYGRHILSHYGNYSNPPKTEKEAFPLGIRPSFHNFIQYILDPQTVKKVPLEPHWRQMHLLCHPCLVQYDFVGHQETLQDDAEELMKMLKIEDFIRFPPVYENVTTSYDVYKWYKDIPLEDRRKLYKLYEQDFKLFGYKRASDILDH